MAVTVENDHKVPEGDVMVRQILLSHEEPWYIARDIATGVVSQGESIESAKLNLREALELYFEDNDETETVPEEYFLGTLEVSA